MHGLRPILDLLRAPWLRFKVRTLSPLAPADMVLPLAIQLADLEARR